MNESNWNNGDGWVLLGSIALYRALGDQRDRDSVLSYLNDTVSPDGEILPLYAQPCGLDAVHCGKALFFAWDETGDERYKKAALKLFERVKALPVSCDADYLFAVMPFLADCDTRFGDKQTYKFISRGFAAARKKNFDADNKLYRTEEDGISLRTTALQMLALTDTAEKMDIQLYEHYRTLADLFLECARSVTEVAAYKQGRLQREGEADEENLTALLLACALMKGVRLGLIDEEKYLPFVEPLMERDDLISEESGPYAAGAYMMAAAEWGKIKA